MAVQAIRTNRNRKVKLAESFPILKLKVGVKEDKANLQALRDQRRGPSVQPSSDHAYSWIRLCWPFIYKRLQGFGPEKVTH